MKRFHFKEIGSTNDYAKELLETETTVIVTADFQTAGRGRNTRTWEGEFGNNVYFSLGLKHDTPPPIDELIAYQALGCIAVKNVLSELTNSDLFRIKYPNDVYAKFGSEYKKICGVLVEHSFSGSECASSVIGIGVNVQQVNFKDVPNNNAVSLGMLGFCFTPEEVIKPLSDEVLKLSKLSGKEIFAIWRKELNLKGKSITILGEDGDWVGVELTDDGRTLLINKADDSTRLIDNGDSIRYDLG